MRNKWVIGGVVIAAAAVTVYFVDLTPKPVAPEPPAQAEAPPPTPTGPVVLPNVVDVLDVEPLLDPPPAPPAAAAPAGVVVTTLDDAPPAAPLQPISAPAFIPPATDDLPVAGDDDGNCDEEEVREEPAAEVAPMPREVVRPASATVAPWADELRVIPGPLFLDAEAAVRLWAPVEEDMPDPWGHEDSWFRRALYARNPLLPLVLSDVDLFRLRYQATDAGTPKPPEFIPIHPVSEWVPQPLKTGPGLGIVSRTYAVIDLPSQTPPTRTVWYTNWYGEHRLPRQLGVGLSSKEWQDELERLNDMVKPRYMPGVTVGCGYFF